METFVYLSVHLFAGTHIDCLCPVNLESPHTRCEPNMVIVFSVRFNILYPATHCRVIHYMNEQGQQYVPIAPQ